MVKSQTILVSYPGRPTAKGRPRFSGHAYTPKKTRDTENALRLLAIRAMERKPPILGPVRLRVTAYITPPHSWSAAKRAAAAATRYAIGRPDFDNISKLVDAFNKVIWHDDAQVASSSFDRFYSLTEPERVDFEIEKLAA